MNGWTDSRHDGKLLRFLSNIVEIPSTSTDDVDIAPQPTKKDKIKKLT